MTVKFIGEIGGAHAVQVHFIERPENLQERLNACDGGGPIHYQQLLHGIG
jgi:hypothetical protein